MKEKDVRTVVAYRGDIVIVIPRVWALGILACDIVGAAAIALHWLAVGA